MIRNYFKIGLRNLRKHPVYAFINLFGLAVAVACCLLIGLFVQHEWSYDRFHSKADRLYRTWTQEKYKGEVFTNVSQPYVLGPSLDETFPEIEAYCRVNSAHANVGKGKGTEVFNEQVHGVDPTFFQLFDFPLISSGNTNPIAELGSVVLTEQMAKKYFGNQNPIGQTLHLQIDSIMQPFTVTAVAKSLPTASSIQFDILIPLSHMMALRSERALKSWFNVSPDNYVLIRTDADAGQLKAKFPSMLKTVLGDRYKDNNYVINLLPMIDVHLNTAGTDGLEPESDPIYSYILASIALFVLIIACINFMTLSLGQSVRRAQEVGVRKTMGALRGQLIGQFWGEALLMTAFSVALGFALAMVLLPLFNQLAGKLLLIRLNLTTLAMVLGLALLVGLIAGSYPALVLSSLRPVEVLKSKLSLKGDRSWLRRSLIVVQFMLAVFLMIGTFVLNQQLFFLRNKSLGYRGEQILIVPVNKGGDQGRQIVERYRNALANRKEVLSVSSSAFPFTAGWGEMGYTDDKKIYREFQINMVDPQFLPTYGIKLVTGRNFDPNNSADVFGSLIVNQAFVKEYGWKYPLNERLTGKWANHRIIGVTQDFHYASLHSKVAPLALMIRSDSILNYMENASYASSRSPDISIKMAAGKMAGNVALLEDVWKSVVPQEPFKYSFLDDNLQQQYETEQRLSRIVTIGSALSILIACLGLFGLATLAVSRRTKEIGIRKVVGASVWSVVTLLSQDFLKLVLIGIFIASPLAWYVLNWWLQVFAYRIDVESWVFVLVGTMALLVAFVTISAQSIKVATMNPIRSLKND
jgi:putative ABC transport system permease protein